MTQKFSIIEIADQMLKSGEEGIVMLENKITELEILDRLGKRMFTLDPKIGNQLGQTQKALSETKKRLIQAQKTQEALKRLRVDLVENPLSVIE